ncbi:MAG: succinate dehydrogenase, hydrophobic membrane anchor protein [Bauldia sp.]
MTMRTPLSRVLHLGSAHGGTEHFWRQRLTAIANVPLVVGLIVVLIATVGRPHGEVVAVLGSPGVAGLMLLAVLSIVVHMRLGMQTIIEDYVAGATKIVLLVANTFFAVAAGAVAVIAILKIALGG